MSKRSKQMGFTGLLYTGIGSIVGSGWLMSSYLVAQSSGPSAILAWLIGAAIISIVAISFIEVCAFLPPKDGGFGHYVEYTHNNFISFICEWVFLLSWIALIPAEATATVQYLSQIFSNAGHKIVGINGGFTALGTLITSFVCLLFFLINYVSVAFLMRLIKYLTLLKILVPIAVAIIIISVAHHITNLGVSFDQFVPYGYHGLLESITTDGVVFAFIGFQTPVTFAAFAKNPKKNIPKAIIFSVIFCTVVYTVLQLSYLIAVPPSKLLADGGWRSLSYTAPFLEISQSYNLSALGTLLTTAAFLSPFGAGLVYFASATRIARGFKGYLPAIITKEGKKETPIGALLFILTACWIILWVLPGWQMIVSIICVTLVILFAIICLTNGALNKFVIVDKTKHGIKIRGSGVFSLIGFVCSSLMYLWSEWPLTWKGFLVIIMGIPIYLFFEKKRNGAKKSIATLFDSSWIILYLIVLVVISYFSSFGGIGKLSFLVSQILVAVCATIFYYVGVNKGNKSIKLVNYLEELNNNAKL